MKIPTLRINHRVRCKPSVAKRYEWYFIGRVVSVSNHLGLAFVKWEGAPALASGGLWEPIDSLERVVKAAKVKH